VEIRDATDSDLRGVAEVHVSSWRAAYAGIVPASHLDALSVDDRERAWRRHQPDKDDRSALLVVVGTSGACDGFAGVGRSRDDDAVKTTGEVQAIYLAPYAWGQGVGRALLAAATERLRTLGYHEATLWVFERNDRARRVYERAGWRPDGRTHTYSIAGAELPELRYRRPLDAAPPALHDGGRDQ
jgi:RimJ/RimL family protein N-acetyltransferase